MENKHAEFKNPENKSKVIYCCVSCFVFALLYFIGCGDIDIGFYTFLRILSLIGLGAFLVQYYLIIERFNSPILYTVLTIWILFNPILPIYMEKETWVVFDVICGIILIVIGIVILCFIGSKGNVQKQDSNQLKPQENNLKENDFSYCRKCGKKLTTDCNFCPYCGTEVK